MGNVKRLPNGNYDIVCPTRSAGLNDDVHCCGEKCAAFTVVKIMPDGGPYVFDCRAFPRPVNITVIQDSSTKEE